MTNMVMLSLAGKEETSVKPALTATFFIVARDSAVPIACDGTFIK